MTTSIFQTQPLDQPELPPVSSATDASIGTGTLQHDPFHEIRSQLRLIEFFRKARNLSMMAITGGLGQEVEDIVWELYNLFDLDGAVGGAALDFLGRIVGEGRDDRSDDAYRAAVRTRILVNGSNGRVEELIAIVLSLLPDAEVNVAEYYPASISVAVDDLGPLTWAQILSMLRRAKPAGVRLEFTSGSGTIGSEDDSTMGGMMGSEDDDPMGFIMASTT